MTSTPLKIDAPPSLLHLLEAEVEPGRRPQHMQRQLVVCSAQAEPQHLLSDSCSVSSSKTFKLVAEKRLPDDIRESLSHHGSLLTSAPWGWLPLG